MNRAITLLSLCMVVVATQFAAGQRLEESIVGKWEFDVEATKKLGAESANIAEFLKPLNMTLEFKRDGQLILMSAPPDAREQKGKWKPTRVDEARSRLMIEADVTGTERLSITATKECVVVKSGDDEIELAFKRAKR